MERKNQNPEPKQLTFVDWCSSLEGIRNGITSEAHQSWTAVMLGYRSLNHMRACFEALK